MKIHAVFLLLFSIIAVNVKILAQNSPPKVVTLESIINERLDDYPLSPDNRFRLASYCELKGRYDAKNDALLIDFGDYGSISFYKKNFLLKTKRHGIFHMDRGKNSSNQVMAMNESLEEVFEQIMLLSNHESDMDLLTFVDEQLSKKNIEPFYKIFVRHILVKYGRYNPALKQVEFKTEWLPDKFYEYLDPGQSHLVRKTITPLRIKLDEKILRGYYIRAGGTVYVEDVKRDVKYATGEEYSPNVTAFKVFAQKLFVQTTQYITTAERSRIKDLKTKAPVYFAHAKTRSLPAGYGKRRGHSIASNASLSNPNSKIQGSGGYYAGVSPLYKPQNWIPMMLGMMRAKKIDITDRDILKYFKNQSYFPDLYKQLTKEEKKAVDRIR